jgi:hypothetical protein
MWRLTDHHAVIYTDDRATKDALLSYARFPYDDIERATTYSRGAKRPYAWQFTFPLSLWNGVVRHLGRASVTFLDVEKPAKTPPAVVEMPAKARGNSGKGQPATKAKPKAAPPPAKPARTGRKPVEPSGPLQPMVAANKNGKPAAKAPALTPAAAPLEPTRTAKPRTGRQSGPVVEPKPPVVPAANAKQPSAPITERRPSGSDRPPAKGGANKLAAGAAAAPTPPATPTLKSSKPSAVTATPLAKSGSLKASGKQAPNQVMPPASRDPKRTRPAPRPAPVEPPPTSPRKRAASVAAIAPALSSRPATGSARATAPQSVGESKPQKRSTLAEKRPEISQALSLAPISGARRTAAKSRVDPSSPDTGPRTAPKRDDQAKVTAQTPLTASRQRPRAVQPSAPPEAPALRSVAKARSHGLTPPSPSAPNSPESGERKRPTKSGLKTHV